MKVCNKIHVFAAMIGITAINGCNINSIPFKGKYADSPVEITSTKPIDSIWLNITQLFAGKGLSIKKLKKEKGLIVSTKSSNNPAYTFEDKDGQLIEPEAWIVLEEEWVNKKKWNPKKIFCQWNIQITETGKGLSMIKVDPIVWCTYYPNMFTNVEQRGQSTGKLEKLLERSLGTH